MQRGDTVLVHAGAGGVGLLLTQMPKMLGARVITTVSTEEKAALSRGAGADDVILYTQESFVDAVKKIAPEGLPVVYDSVGKTTFEQLLAARVTRGDGSAVGGSSGAVPPFALIHFRRRGSLYVTRPTLKDYVQARAALDASRTTSSSGLRQGS